MYYLVDRDEMREIDRRTIEERGIPGILLMERAAITILGEINSKKGNVLPSSIKCLIVVDGGNNGGDGLALARLLAQQGDQVDVCYIRGISKVSESFSYQLDIVTGLGIKVTDSIPSEKYDIVVDGIFGVGLKREITGIWKTYIQLMNDLPCYKLAIDLPSGVDATTGQVLGIAFKADETVTFGLNKRGLVLHPGCDHAGRVVVKDIGFSEREITSVAPEAYTYGAEDLMRLPKRIDNSNKGTYGKVAVIAGSRDMSGAAAFAAKTVYRMGAGLVKVYTHNNNRTVIGTLVPEAILMTYGDNTADGKNTEAVRCAEDAVAWADVIIIGPGLGRSEAAADILRYIICEAEQPLVVDADALNIISEDKELQHCLGSHRGEVVVTPHMGEMSRLTGISIPEIKKNILKVCKDFAMEYNVIDVLKDSRTCVCRAGGDIYINTTGNNGMSTAGAGDVLTGVIGGLIATGLQPYDAAVLGVFIHGMAGDIAAGRIGESGMMARDIVEAIPQVISSGSMTHTKGAE